MSMFTEFNGPGGRGGPTVSELTALIEAFNNLSTKLSQHVESSAGSTGSVVHGIRSYIEAVTNELTQTINSKANNNFVGLGTISKIDNREYNTILEAVNALNTHLEASFAKNTTLNNYVPKTSASTLANEANKLISNDEVKQMFSGYDLDNIVHKDEMDSAISDAFAGVGDTRFDTLVANVFKASQYLMGRLLAHRAVDFNVWSQFSAPFAGTGSSIDTETAGAYVLGCASSVWESGSGAPTVIGARHKAGRAYIKYVNSAPFDAIIDYVVSYTGEKFVGNIFVNIAKKAGTWNDLAFHLLHGTDGSGNKNVYLAMSSKDLTTTGGTAYSNVEFRAVGINFIPVGSEGYSSPSGLIENIASANVDAAAEALFSVNRLRTEELWTNKYYDGDGLLLFKVNKKTDTATDVTYKQMLIGDPTIDEITFIKRPGMIVTLETGEQLFEPFVTAEDISDVSLPIGAILRWAPVDEDGNLKDIPETYLACDGSEINNTDYPKLCELLGANELGIAKLPTEDHAIIKAKYLNIVDQTSQPDYDELISFSLLNKKLQQEQERATTAEHRLADDIYIESAAREAADDKLQEALTNEAYERNNVDTALQAALSAEEVVRESADTKLQDAIDAIKGGADESVTLATLASDIDINSDAIDEETAARTAAVTELESEISAIKGNAAEGTSLESLANDIATTNNDIKQELTDMRDEYNDAITTETERATAAENELSNRITDIVGDDGDGLTLTSLKTSVDAEVTARETADNELSDRITAESDTRNEQYRELNERVTVYEGRDDTLEQKITEETNRATAAEANLQQQITDNKTAADTKDIELEQKITEETTRATEAEADLQQQITDNKTAAEEADTTLQQNIDTVNQQVETNSTNIATNTAGIEANKTAIETEATTREEADTNLQTQLDEEKQSRTQSDIELNDRITQYHPGD